MREDGRRLGKLALGGSREKGESLPLGGGQEVKDHEGDELGS